MQSGFQESGNPFVVVGHVLPLGQQTERLSFRDSLIPTSRFTSTPRSRTRPRFSPVPRAPSRDFIAELEANPVSYETLRTLAVLQSDKVGATDSGNTAGSSIYSTISDFKADNHDASPYGELPKVAIKRGLRSNWTLIAPHILAIALTIAVCQLGFWNMYWMDLLPPNSKIALGLTQRGALNFLQIAAKLHELAILGSVSTVGLHIFQASLTGPDGIPLGLTSNVFELGSGSFLGRQSFWASIVSSGDSTGKRFRFTHIWAFSFFATIMVMISGPSSAIAIIPTLNYFSVPKPFNQTIGTLFIYNRSTELWPTQLTAASLNAPDSGFNCTNVPTNSGVQEICPAGGFREIYSWASSVAFANNNQLRNISFQDESGNTRRIVTARSCNSTFHGKASGIGMNAFLHRALTTYWTFAQQKFHGTVMQAAQPQINVDTSNTKLYAPRVEVLCNSFDNHKFQPSDPSSQESMTFPTFDNSQVQVPDWAYKYSRPLNGSNFTFVQMPEQPLPFLGAVLIHPVLEKFDGSYIQSTENLACSIYTSWVPITVSFEPTVSDQVSYTVQSKLSSTCLQASVSSASGEQQPLNTTIDINYANAINQKIRFPNSDVPALSAIHERFIFSDSLIVKDARYFATPVDTATWREYNNEEARASRARFVATILAGAVTDGLARNAGNGVFPYSSPMLLLPNRTAGGEPQGKFLSTVGGGSGRDMSLNTTNMDDTRSWVQLELSFKRYGYGYYLTGNRTAQFAIFGLLAHALVALCHVLYVLYRVLFTGASENNNGMVRAWESIPDLIALALTSQPPQPSRCQNRKLANTCAGISEKGTWRETLAVRETSSGGLEIVVGESEICRSRGPRAGVRYGS